MEIKEYKLFDGEYRFVTIVWEHEPVSSGALVKLSEGKLGWKKSTTYTVLKKLCERGVLRNQNSVVTALVKKEQVQCYESGQVIDRTFDGSLPQFVASFISGRKLSEQEIQELRVLIDACEQGGEPHDNP